MEQNSIENIVKKLLIHYSRNSDDYLIDHDRLDEISVIDRERIKRLHHQISGELVSSGIKQPWADFIAEDAVVSMCLGTEKRVAIDRAIDHFYFYMHKAGHLDAIIANLSQDSADSIRKLVRDMDTFYDSMR